MARPTAARVSLLGVFTLLALLALPAEAQWKWRDSTGHIQYSDLPPPVNTPERDILARPSPEKVAQIPVGSASAAPATSNAASAPSVATADPDLEAKLKKAQSDLAAKQKTEDDRVAAAKADNCNRARSQVRTIESGIRLVRTNDKGEREFLDDDARAAEMKRSRDIIAADCK